MTDRVSLAAERLLRGDSGEEVMAWLRTKCSTVAALSVCISRVRAKILQQLPPPPCDALIPYMHESDDIADFCTRPLWMMLGIQRAHQSDPRWSEEAEAALQGLELLPPNVAALKLTSRDLLKLKRAQEQALLQKQLQLVPVPDATAVLQRATEMCRASTADMPIARLALPLCLLSGRRSTELLNGKSTFAPTLRPTVASFAGQLKKRGHSDAPYDIPLLCDLDTFAHGVAMLRRAQGGEVLEPAACNNKYHRMLAARLHETFPWANHVHVLRAAYVQYVDHLYACNTTLNAVAMRVCGHDKLEVSLSYNHVKLKDLDPALGDSLGPLP